MLQEQLSIANKIAIELNLAREQVESVILLIDEGRAISFIAKYEKLKTNGLSVEKLRSLILRLKYLRELEDRRLIILKSLAEQNKLTDDITNDICSVDTKANLENLYLLYRSQENSLVNAIKENDLEELVNIAPEEYVKKFINNDNGILDIDMALDFARGGLIKYFTGNINLLETLWSEFFKISQLSAIGLSGKKDKNNKYVEYFNFVENINKISVNTLIGLFRGRNDSALKLTVNLPKDSFLNEDSILKFFDITKDSPAFSWLSQIARQVWTTQILPKFESQVLRSLKARVDTEVIRVFSINLRGLLLSARAGGIVTIGLLFAADNGVQIAVVDGTGELLDFCTIFPVGPQNDWHQSIATLAKFAIKYQVKLISIGNGVGAKDLVRLIDELIKTYPDLDLSRAVINELGVAAYSLSKLSEEELPGLDIFVRRAVSIARRLQDPFLEIAKLDSKDIGAELKAYVNQAQLLQAINDIIDDVIATIGVDVNFASYALLSRLPGLDAKIAKSIVAYRDKNGSFKNREELKQVQGMEGLSYQQAIGFLKINHGDNLLDSSFIHPEDYNLVQQILTNNKLTLETLISSQNILTSLELDDSLVAKRVFFTIDDIVKELKNLNIDLIPKFRAPVFKVGVEDIEDLSIGLQLEGIISNVTDFGAFVDIGVHQDGLVHKSAITDKFVEDPRMIVKIGDIVKVKVLAIDKKRRRISLTMNLEAEAQKHSKTIKKPKKIDVLPIKKSKKAVFTSNKPIFNTAMADALIKLRKGDA